MNRKEWIEIFGATLLSAGLLFSPVLRAEIQASDGYTLDDYELRTAADLVDVCTTDPGNPHHEIAQGFCFGFFEGGAAYHQALKDVQWYDDLLCDPPGVTRSQAVDVFVQYMKVNPQHSKEPSIDAIFRALIDKWPCEKP
jgi:hypothetical protein